MTAPRVTRTAEPLNDQTLFKALDGYASTNGGYYR